MTTTTTTTPAVKRADELQAGDWLPNFDGDPAEVLYLDTSTHAGRAFTSVVARGRDGMLAVRRFFADQEVELAGPELIAGFRERVDRGAVADALRTLANIITGELLPVRGRTVDLTFALKSREDVEEVGKVLGLPVVVNPTVNKHSVYWPDGEPYTGAPVVADFYWYDRGAS